MLELTLDAAGRPGFLIRAISPMPYLDHWAFRKFAAEPPLASRLAAALEARGGTLAVSWLNLGEYANVTDLDQRLEAERLLDRLLPAVFCINVEPFEVVARQRRGDPRAHADEALAQLFWGTAGARAPTTVRPFTASGLFEPLNHRRLVESKARLSGIIKGRLEALRQVHATDAGFRTASLRADRSTDAHADTPTLAITRTLVSTFFPDLKREITDNDALDFLHAAVPVSFCDAVLLDGATVHAVEQARRKPTRVRMAPVFSGRGDGVERFLAYLEGLPSPGKPTT